MSRSQSTEPITARSPLYGEPNRSPFWVLNLSPEGPGKLPPLSLPGNHLVFICLRAGSGWFEDGRGESSDVAAGDLVAGATGRTGGLLRQKAETDGVIVGFHRPVIRESLEPHRPAVLPRLKSLALYDQPEAPEKLSLPEPIRGTWIDEFRRPPVDGAAATFWREGKIREFIALGCFSAAENTSQKEFFCTRQKRLASERIERTRAWLEARLDDPLDLNALAEHVGCSSHYLSRTFSEATGTTISQHLRQIRIDKAAELLTSGRFSVSEAAVEVGYQSLSHFSKAFQKEKGCLPSRFTGAM